MSTPTLPPHDPWGGACTGCGAGLAADQRYCLACGTRRDGARLPYRDALATEPVRPLAPATVHAVRAADPYGASAAAGTPTLLTTLAALACVLLAFGVGVLVGGGDDGGGQPLVVPAAAAAATPTTTAATADTTAEVATTTDDAEASTADDASDEEESATPTKPKPAPKKLVESSKKAIQGLEKAKTPEEYAEQSAKLPDVVVTGGGK